jgi:hypothetical protein
VTPVSVAAILFSALLLGLLGWQDPKRLRNASHDMPAAPRFSAPQRRILGWLSLAPGVVLTIAGEWWALLMWLGASCTLGWLTAQVLTRWSLGAFRSP